MSSAQFVLYLMCLFLGKTAPTANLKFSSAIHQEQNFVSIKTGENLTLQCVCEGDIAARHFWYKQILGQKPRLISSFYKFEKNGTFHNEFKNDPRFTLQVETGKNHLIISNVRLSDSATYYCASSYSYKFEFAEGTAVSVKGSGLNIQTLVHQSSSETIQPGDSVNLSCTVHTGTCDGGHSVFWFKDSEDSDPGLIYTHGDKTDQCERKPETQTHICVYNLLMQNLNVSHTGTYYCAVTSCGLILFGNGTKVDLKDEVALLILVNFLRGAVAFTTILCVLLVSIMCVIKKRGICKCAVAHASSIAQAATANTEGQQNEENIHYAALKGHKVNRTRRQQERNNIGADCVYSSIKPQN